MKPSHPSSEQIKSNSPCSKKESSRPKTLIAPFASPSHSSKDKTQYAAHQIELLGMAFQLFTQSGINPDKKLLLIRFMKELYFKNVENKKFSEDCITLQHITIVLNALYDSNPDIMKAALCFIGNTTYYSSVTKMVVGLNAIPTILPLLKSDDDAILTPVLQFIGNTVLEGVEYRDLLINAGMIKELASMLMRKYSPLKLNLAKEVVWIASNMIKDKIFPKKEIMKPIYYIVKDLLLLNNEGIKTECMTFISYLAMSNNRENFEDFNNKEVITHLIEEFNSKNLVCASSALKFIGQVASFLDSDAALIIDLKGLIAVRKVLHSTSNELLLRLALWLLSNLASCPYGIEQVLSLQFIDKLCEIGKSGESLLRQEALFALSSLSSTCSVKQISCFAMKLIELAVEILSSTSESQVILILLNITKQILHSGASATGENMYARKFQSMGGLILLDKLQGNVNHEIYSRTQEILTYFFSKSIENDQSQEVQMPSEFHF
jgi:hypothetical protein